MGLPAEARLLAILAFNLGVELGQIALVLVAVPLAYTARNTPPYARAVVPGGSAAVVALAAVWLLQRIGGT